MHFPLWRRSAAAAMRVLSQSVTAFLMAPPFPPTAALKQILLSHSPNSRVTWGSRGSATTSEKTVSVESIATVIDGKAAAQEIIGEVAAEVSRMRYTLGKVPGLAVVLVGARRDSEIYVRCKKQACEETGIISLGRDFPENSSEDEVLRAVKSFNNDPSVHGVLVQLPLPQHINEEKILNAVSIEKDVDGFHPLNIGCLAMQGREPLFVPCTPKGCIELLLRSRIEMIGKRAVVIGCSNIVGMPAAILLQRHNATVTIVHSYTKNPEDIIRKADIVISAAGVPNLVRGSWLKPGAVVIDVGINVMEDCNDERGNRLVGDVCYKEASRIASAITPVPGGVGPMTIAMLMSNTLEAAKRTFGLI